MEYMMRELPKERLIIAVASIAVAQKAFDITVDYVNTRTAFGRTIGSMQNTRFSLADLKADLSVGWAYVDQCLAELTDGSLTTERASIAKLWVTEMQGRLVDRYGCLAGGFGQREVRLDLVAVAAAVFLLRHVAGSVRPVTMP